MTVTIKTVAIQIPGKFVKEYLPASDATLLRDLDIDQLTELRDSANLAINLITGSAAGG